MEETLHSAFCCSASPTNPDLGWQIGGLEKTFGWMHFCCGICWSAPTAAAYLSRISTNPMSNTRYYTSIGGRHVLASKVANL